jgi:hypothetical protein
MELTTEKSGEQWTSSSVHVFGSVLDDVEEELDLLSAVVGTAEALRTTVPGIVGRSGITGMSGTSWTSAVSSSLLDDTSMLLLSPSMGGELVAYESDAFSFISVGCDLTQKVARWITDKYYFTARLFDYTAVKLTLTA